MVTHYGSNGKRAGFSVATQRIHGQQVVSRELAIFEHRWHKSRIYMGGVWERLEEGFLYSSPSGSTGTFTFGTDGLAIGHIERTAVRVAVWKRVA